MSPGARRRHVDERRQAADANLLLPKLGSEAAYVGIGERPVLREPVDARHELVDWDTLAQQVLAPAPVVDGGEGSMVRRRDEVERDPEERRPDDAATLECSGELLLLESVQARPYDGVRLQWRLRLHGAEPLHRAGDRQPCPLEQKLPRQGRPVEGLSRERRQASWLPGRAGGVPCAGHPRRARLSRGPARNATCLPPARRSGTCSPSAAS